MPETQAIQNEPPPNAPFPMTTRLTHQCWIVLCLGVMPACSWMPWSSHSREPVHHGIISVCLNTPPNGKKSTYAVASVHQGRKLKPAGFKQVNKQGEASFVVPMGSLYDVQIFCDLNRNQSLDANEPNGLVQNVSPAPLTAADTGVLMLAFGVVGPVEGHARPQAFTPVGEQPQLPSIPGEAEPYLKHIPPWLQDKLLR